MTKEHGPNCSGHLKEKPLNGQVELPPPSVTYQSPVLDKHKMPANELHTFSYLYVCNIKVNLKFK